MCSIKSSHSVATCQDKTVAVSSLTPHAALLVHPSGTIHPVVDCYEFTRSDKCCLWKQTWSSSALSLVCLDITRVWLSCLAIKYDQLHSYIAMWLDLRKPSFLAHFTHCSSFGHNYLIIHPILIFKVLLYSVIILQEICVIITLRKIRVDKFCVPFRKVFTNPVIIQSKYTLHI